MHYSATWYDDVITGPVDLVVDISLRVNGKDFTPRICTLGDMPDFGGRSEIALRIVSLAISDLEKIQLSLQNGLDKSSEMTTTSSCARMPTKQQD